MDRNVAALNTQLDMSQTWFLLFGFHARKSEGHTNTIQYTLCPQISSQQSHNYGIIFASNPIITAKNNRWPGVEWFHPLQNTAFQVLMCSPVEGPKCPPVSFRWTAKELGTQSSTQDVAKWAAKRTGLSMGLLHRNSRVWILGFLWIICDGIWFKTLESNEHYQKKILEVYDMWMNMFSSNPSWVIDHWLIPHIPQIIY